MISNLAYIHPKAKLGNNVTVEPFAVIYGNVEIGDNSWVGPNATIYSDTFVGENCKIFNGVSLGAINQDMKYKGEPTTTVIGKNTTIREFATIHKGTTDRNTTKVGDNCLIMAYAHLGHDCLIGNNVILANCVQLAGHITVEDYVICEGVVLAQQFITIGKHAFVAGSSLVRKNVPPYMRVAREPLQYIGVNSIGLARRGFSKEIITEIEDIYRIIFVRGHAITKALDAVEAEMPDTAIRKEILDFIRNSKDGIVKGI